MRPDSWRSVSGPRSAVAASGRVLKEYARGYTEVVEDYPLLTRSRGGWANYPGTAAMAFDDLASD